jgi:hypothetical protein
MMDARTLAEAKRFNIWRIGQAAARRLEEVADGPHAQSIQWLALGALAANSGVAFASWPAGTRNAWNNNVAPIVAAVDTIRIARATAVAAVNAATTNEEADAVVW